MDQELLNSYDFLKHNNILKNKKSYSLMKIKDLSYVYIFYDKRTNNSQKSTLNVSIYSIYNMLVSIEETMKIKSVADTIEMLWLFLQKKNACSSYNNVIQQNLKKIEEKIKFLPIKKHIYFIQQLSELIYDLVHDQLFTNDNKRIGFFTLIYYLNLNGYKMRSTITTLVNLFLHIAMGKINYDRLGCIIFSQLEIIQEIKSLEELYLEYHDVFIKLGE